MQEVERCPPGPWASRASAAQRLWAFVPELKGRVFQESARRASRRPWFCLCSASRLEYDAGVALWGRVAEALAAESANACCVCTRGEAWVPWRRMLVLRDLRKVFGTIVAVDGVSLTVEAGEVFGLLGPNGAGKTTTISMAVGLLVPDSGSAELGGLGNCSDPRVRASIGMAPQALALYDQLSAEENLRFFGSLYGLRGGRLSARVTEVLEAVGLADRRGDRAGTYSGGMKRRLNLAAALVHDPPVLLLDEPTAGVDPQSRAGIVDMVRAQKARGKTVIYTTHYMEEAQKVCDRVGIIDHGKLLDVGTVDELISRHGGESTVTVLRRGVEERIRTGDAMRTLAEVARDPEASSVRIDRPDLETVFLSLTGRRLRD